MTGSDMTGAGRGGQASNQAHSRAYDQIKALLEGDRGYESEGSFDVNKTFCQGLVAGTRVLPLFLAVGCWGEPSNEGERRADEGLLARVRY